MPGEGDNADCRIEFTGLLSLFDRCVIASIVDNDDLKVLAEFMEKGAAIYSKGRIVGGTGLTLALAKERGLTGICLLGATMGFKADRGAGYHVFKFLMKTLGKEIKERSPEKH